MISDECLSSAVPAGPMMDSSPLSLGSKNQEDVKRCEVCNESLAKYRCPRCCLRTCSLVCVKQHKVASGCDGQRDKTKFVAIKEFGDLELLNDYRFLEDVDRKVDGTTRDTLKQHNRRPNFLKKLIGQARKRGVSLKVMPQGSTRRRQNSTCFSFQAGAIFWHVEWLFPNAEVKHYSRRVKETEKIESLLDGFLLPTESDPILRHKLKSYVAVDRSSIKILMKAEQRKANCPRYYEFDPLKSLADNLRGKIVIEFPTLHVVHGSMIKQYPTIQEDSLQNNENSEDSESEAEEDNAVQFPATSSETKMCDKAIVNDASRPSHLVVCDSTTIKKDAADVEMQSVNAKIDDASVDSNISSPSTDYLIKTVTQDTQDKDCG